MVSRLPQLLPIEHVRMCFDILMEGQGKSERKQEVWSPTEPTENSTHARPDLWEKRAPTRYPYYHYSIPYKLIRSQDAQEVRACAFRKPLRAVVCLQRVHADHADCSAALNISRATVKRPLVAPFAKWLPVPRF